MISKEKSLNSRGSVVLPGGRVGILLIHSLGGSPIELRFIAHSLSRLGYTVSCPLLKGLAGGTDVSGMSTWEDWYEAADQALTDLKSQCDTVIVGGVSAGSMVSLRLAALRPNDVTGTVLFAPTLWPNGWAIPFSLHLFKLVSEKWTAKLFNFRAREPHGIKDERIRNFVMNSIQNDEGAVETMLSRSGSLIFQFHRMVRNVKPLLGRIRQPALIFHPREDDQSDLSNAITLQRKLGGRVELVVLEDSYHMVTLDRQRNFVAERTIEFADRVTRRADEAVASSRLFKSVD